MSHYLMQRTLRDADDHELVYMCLHLNTLLRQRQEVWEPAGRHDYDARLVEVLDEIDRRLWSVATLAAQEQLPFPTTQPGGTRWR